MTKSPSVPKEQRSFADHGARSVQDMADRRDLATGVQSGQSGDADVNTGQQGRFGNLKQNMTPQWKRRTAERGPPSGNYPATAVSGAIWL